MYTKGSFLAEREGKMQCNNMANRRIQWRAPLASQQRFVVLLVHIGLCTKDARRGLQQLRVTTSSVVVYVTNLVSNGQG